MALAEKKYTFGNNGLEKKRAVASFQELLDQIRIMDQKLTMKVDSEIWHKYQDQQNKIYYTKAMIDRVNNNGN
ncbi:hypothetical protein [Virgibacillus sp. YIM 98842]|uniref:hypothetical protein n=1 Tax=Virgibacillus sp. YIM 98842 TaxID=2663533 RepID=UPI0013DAAF8C|nr:hypothetical protein [Virgibacillus sp. YIM 98842]